MTHGPDGCIGYNQISDSVPSKMADGNSKSQQGAVQLGKSSKQQAMGIFHHFPASHVTHYQVNPTNIIYKKHISHPQKILQYPIVPPNKIEEIMNCIMNFIHGISTRSVSTKSTSRRAGHHVGPRRSALQGGHRSTVRPVEGGIFHHKKHGTPGGFTRKNHGIHSGND